MAALLTLTDLSFSYPDGRRALNGVCLAIEPGEKLALVGPNGAGKSTLMLQLNGILRGQGTVTIDGITVDDPTLGQVRALVGLVFQDPDDQLFSPTVFEDVAFGPLHMGLPPSEVTQRVQDALAAVGMAGFAERVPYHLSTGEKKRVALATVLAMRPRLLVLDEPTAGLDPRARRGLINLLRTLDVTMLVSTHDLAMIPGLFDRTVMMDGGLIVADGPSDAILRDAALLEAHGLEPLPVLAQ